MTDSAEDHFSEIEPKAKRTVPTAAQITAGLPVPPVTLLQVMSFQEWESFTEEWLTYHKSKGTYQSIRRYSGPRDLGLDVVAFTSSLGFAAPWDSYQCKHYDHALEPNDVLGEVGKIIYHSFRRTPPFNQACRTPRRHVFVPPLGVGITVGRWLKDPIRFKNEVRKKWESHCVPKIGKDIEAPLEGDFLEYFDAFDFSIFQDKTGVELIEEHAQTVFHVARFGGGLAPREEVLPPPAEPTAAESLYLRKLLDAYGDHLGKAVAAKSALMGRPDLEEHYNRQRVLFYSAESLRNFARDRTPPQTFESLKDDIYHGVVDVCEAKHVDSLERLRATVVKAASLPIAGNALVGVTRVADKQGICHQLANDDRLSWKRRDG